MKIFADNETQFTAFRCNSQLPIVGGSLEAATSESCIALRFEVGNRGATACYVLTQAEADKLYELLSKTVAHPIPPQCINPLAKNKAPKPVALGMEDATDSA